jgi:hypothetical protein
MPDHGHGHHGPPDTSRGFEQSDLEFGAIGKGVLFYFIFTAGIGVVVYLGFLFFHQAEVPSQTLSVIPSAPYPLLQNNITDRTDIWNLRSKEDFLLHNSTYVDASKKTVRVPVDDVINQVGNGNDPSALNIASEAPKPTEPKAESAPAAGGQTITEPPTPKVERHSREPEATKTRTMPAPLQGSLKIKPDDGGRQ